MEQSVLSKIDVQCIPLVIFFNRQGLTTKYSCEGHINTLNHTFYIMFDDNLPNEIMINFINKIKRSKGHFYKWYRFVNFNEGVKANWVYEINAGNVSLNNRLAKIDLKKFEQAVV